MLDHQDRHAGLGNHPDQLDHLRALDRVETAERFVEQEHLRTHGERGGKHQALSREHRQLAGQCSLLGGQAAEGQGIERVILRLVLEPERRMLSVTPECAPNQHVGQYGLTIERDSGLKGAREAEPADLVRAQPLDLAVFELDDAAGGGIDARDAVEKGRFAGAVRPDDGIHLAGLDGKAQVAYREQSSIGLADLLALEDRHSWV